MPRPSRPPRRHRHRSERCPVRAMRRRDPSFWNTLLFHLRGIPLHLTYLRFAMNTSTLHSSSRRNTVIRTVAAVTGDIAAGLAVASACMWLIESAALGLFLTFVVWLLGSLLALALSQYVVHPAVGVVLSDRKLDLAVDALSGLSSVLTAAGAELGHGLLGSVRSALRRRGLQPA